MATKYSKGRKLPPELQGLAEVEDVNALEEKLAEKLARCYSQDKYEEFQTAVEKISLKAISDEVGRDKVKTIAKDATKEFLEERGWRSKSFWIPVVISIVGLLVAAAAIIYK